MATYSEAEAQQLINNLNQRMAHASGAEREQIKAQRDQLAAALRAEKSDADAEKRAAEEERAAKTKAAKAEQAQRTAENTEAKRRADEEKRRLEEAAAEAKHAREMARQREMTRRKELDKELFEARQEQKRQEAAAKKAKQRRESLTHVTQRESIGRSSSNTKLLGDSVTAAGAGVASGAWVATRKGMGAYWWGLGLTGVGAIAMLESKPGTFLESAGAGVLAASATVTTLHLFGLAK